MGFYEYMRPNEEIHALFCWERRGKKERRAESMRCRERRGKQKVGS